jgi:hypothetical protein
MILRRLLHLIQARLGLACLVQWLVRLLLEDHQQAEHLDAPRALPRLAPRRARVQALRRRTGPLQYRVADSQDPPQDRTAHLSQALHDRAEPAHHARSQGVDRLALRAALRPREVCQEEVHCLHDRLGLSVLLLLSSSSSSSSIRSGGSSSRSIRSIRSGGISSSSRPRLRLARAGARRPRLLARAPPAGPPASLPALFRRLARRSAPLPGPGCAAPRPGAPLRGRRARGLPRRP